MNDLIYRTACHELGHAFGLFDADGAVGNRLTIIIKPNGDAWIEGGTCGNPQNQIVMLAAGWEAEKLLCGDDLFRSDGDDRRQIPRNRRRCGTQRLSGPKAAPDGAQHH